MIAQKFAPFCANLLAGRQSFDTIRLTGRAENYLWRLPLIETAFRLQRARQMVSLGF